MSTVIPLIDEKVYLSPHELFVLTGRKQRPKQLAWLKAERWRHTKDADGNPLVSRDYWRKRMVEGHEEVAAPPLPEWVPGFMLQRERKRA